MTEPLKVNGTEIVDPTPKNIFNSILDCLSGIEYWSDESLIELYKGCLDLASEAYQWEREGKKGGAKAKYTRAINRATKRKNDVMILKSQNRLERRHILSMIYNEILTNEGLKQIK